MAHWSTGYADFHDEIAAHPPPPSEPPRIPCPECDVVFTTSPELHEHVFTTHPIGRPILMYRGSVCGGTRQLVQRAPRPADWSLLNCDWARINGTEVAPQHLGSRLSEAKGVVAVQIGNSRTDLSHHFDFAIAAEQDLEAVDKALADLLAGGVLTWNSIASFFDRTVEFESARNYNPDTIEIPHKLLWFTEPGTCISGVRDTGHGTFLLSGEPVTDPETLAIMRIPAHETAVLVPIGQEVRPDAPATWR